MGLKNKISEGYAYFITMTVVDWVDVFTRRVYKDEIVESLKYCREHKGLAINGWVIMTNHIHLIAYAKEGYHLSDILRDFKKYASKKMIALIKEEPESRREWMLNHFEFAGRNDKKIKDYKFWQDGNEAKEIHSDDFYRQKLNYIHENPVVTGFVDEPQYYPYSSAIDYCGGKGMIEIDE